MTSAIVLAAVLPLALAPIRARVLGPSGRGEFAYFQAALSVITAVSAIGIRHAYYAVTTPGDPRPHLKSRRITLSASGLSLGLGIPLAWIGFASLSSTVGWSILIVALGGPLFAMTQLEVASAQRDGRRKRIVAFAGLPSLVEFVGNIALLALRSLTLWTAITVTLFSELSRSLAGIRARALDKPHLAPRDMVVLRTFEKASWILAPATLVPILASNIDSLIYGALAPTSQLGLYAVAKIATSILLLGAITLEGYFLQDVFQRGLRKALGRNGLALIGVAAAGAVLGLLLVPLLFGAAYHAAALAFPLSATAGTLGVIYVWFSAHLASRGLQRLSLISAAAVLITLTAGCFIVTRFPSINPEIMIVPLIVAYLAGSLTSLVALRRRRDTSAVNSLIDAE